MKIAFDLDGVVADSFQQIRKRILEMKNFDILENLNSYSLVSQKLDYDESQKIIYDVIIKENRHIKMYPEAKDVLTELYEATNEPICFVTARPKEAKRATKRWLDRNLNVPYNIFFSTPEKKEKYLIEGGFKFFVEDRAETVNKCEKMKINFLITRPWNETQKTNTNVIRVNNLNEVKSKYLLFNNIYKMFLI
ncbi:MAG: 5' nucleotidase, deoxy (Pyrimidine), cytosolic type C protein (NT5C) [candidate division CPR1 bacterium ADurb.Bin160]|uniref:5' nucleotidase, deoxy (Pyrimidine), cytosolic type C protein (NT5C) n=1 Tax=candidate division CPR1 bacterium ADurb.Bin160 TaxID=1852826 RepID=A0A1V5ZN31_9BACT|nr:MAG: 5' nucleotidase, deoxy (Pyrimidine), cytosolic type C protein (NT5C) [candidate division CPR1 bacterium ADurb.Bin160]